MTGPASIPVDTLVVVNPECLVSIRVGGMAADELAALAAVVSLFGGLPATGELITPGCAGFAFARSGRADLCLAALRYLWTTSGRATPTVTYWRTS